MTILIPEWFSFLISFILWTGGIGFSFMALLVIRGIIRGAKRES